MVSTKFKPGQRVKYDADGEWRYGIVAGRAEAEAGEARLVVSNYYKLKSPRVWAYWSSHDTASFMAEDRVFSDGPVSVTRNLPDWF